MPDMSQPGAHFQSLRTDFKTKAQLLRRDAGTLVTRAEIWEEAAWAMDDAIREEAKKVAAVTPAGDPK